MAVIEGGTTFSLQEVGLAASVPAHITAKPTPHGALGHYRYSVRILSTAAQAANSRIFELRNTAATNIILTSLKLTAIQVAAGTLQENSLDVFRCTAFSAVDTVNTVTPTSSVKRTTGMAAFPGGAAPRHLTVTGVAAGMTGGTLTKDGNMFATLPYMVTAGVATATYQPPQWGPLECADILGGGAHPFVFAQNEGFEIENRVLNVTSMGIAWFIDVAWVEATAY